MSYANRVQISKSLENSKHNLLDWFKTVIPNGAWTWFEGDVHHVGAGNHPQITYGKRLIVRDYKEKLFGKHSLSFFGLVSWLIPKVLIFNFDYILAEAFALDLVKGGQLSLLIPAVVKQFLYSHKVLGLLVWVRRISWHTASLYKFGNVFSLHLTCIDCFYHRTEGTLSDLLQVDVAFLSLNYIVLSFFVMLLFEVYLLEKLQLLQNTQ